MLSNMSDKEKKLTVLVQRLERKIKDVWDENKKLTQNIELSQLDKEISEENARALEAQLQQTTAQHTELQAKIDQLSELNDLNAELESSYNAEKQRLEDEITTLKQKLEGSDFNIQRFEALQFDLKTCERKLRAAELDVQIVRNGIETTLIEIIGPESWIPLIEPLNIDASKYLDQFKLGECTSKQLSDQLKQLVDEFDAPLSVDQAKALLQLDNNSAPALSRIIHNKSGLIESIKLEQNSQPAESEENIATRESQGEIETLKLRIGILEDKLLKAQSLAAELDALQNWQREAIDREATLHEKIKQLNQSIEEKDQEITHLTRQALPTELARASNRGKISELESTITYLTRKSSPMLRLDPLHYNTTPLRISATAGNKRVHHLRKLKFELGDRKSAAKLASDQEVELMFI